jgi:hypothetical protein
VFAITSCKRKRLSLREKIEILDYRDSHPEIGIRGIPVKFEVSKSQVSDILKDREALHQLWVKNDNEDRKWTKRQKKETSVIDDEVPLWFSKLREKNLPVSGPLIQEKSREVAEKYGFSDFQGSKNSGRDITLFIRRYVERLQR